tara:strand:+ start:1183 stop:1650 length:468 start_codon:yes stop_codon:yes gene_type:complete
MNAYSELLRYIKKLAEEDEYIKTVLSRSSDDFDWEKGNIYPIFNVSALRGSFPTPALVTFSIELVCVDIRDLNPEDSEDKFWNNDNEVDNHNSTLASLSGIWTKLNRNFANNDIVASDNPTINQIEFDGVNLADGWSMTFDVTMPIRELNLCEGC